MVEELTYDSDKKRPSSSIIILRDAMCHFFILLEQGFFVFCLNSKSISNGASLLGFLNIIGSNLNQNG